MTDSTVPPLAPQHFTGNRNTSTPNLVSHPGFAGKGARVNMREVSDDDLFEVWFKLDSMRIVMNGLLDRVNGWR